MDRRKFLKAAGLGGLGSAAFPYIATSAGEARHWPRLGKPPNLLIIITDEQRAVQYWPEWWAEKNLPSMRRLRRHGLDFTQAFTNGCQCSPSRATLMTGQYAPVNRVTVTSGTLNADLPNLATILAKAGYNVFYKGKWHLTFDYIHPYATLTGADIEQAITNDAGLQSAYGFAGWNSPDAGTTANQILATLGGGVAANDSRFTGGSSFGANSIREFLASYDLRAPFCLIASLVNPHDVFVYPTFFANSGYGLADFAALPIALPPTFKENLSTKPPIQAEFLANLNNLWPFTQSNGALLYARFYAFLTTLADKYVMQILDAVEANGLTESTLIIRIADHGEMAMSHGGLRQKDYTAYEEVIRIPMIFSNPILFPEPLKTDCPAGLIDILPTLVTIAGLDRQRDQWPLQGHDLTPLFRQPYRHVQDEILFTYDDQFGSPPLTGAGHIRCIREARWKFALYFAPGQQPSDYIYEMYDLKNDPTESYNLAFGKPPLRYKGEYERLLKKLNAIMESTGTLPQDYRPPDGPVLDPIVGV